MFAFAALVLQEPAESGLVPGYLMAQGTGPHGRDSWGDAPEHVQSCNNTGVGYQAKDKGTRENPKDCECWNPCQKDMDENNLTPFERAHGDRKCKTTCRRSTCHCKSPCT